MKIILQTQIWGKEYADIFIKHALPMVERSLKFIQHHDIEYCLYTDSDAGLILKDYPLFETIRHSWFDLKDITKHDFVYEREADCKFHCMCEAVKQDATVIFVDANQVISPKNFENYIKLIEAGNDAVILKSPRVLYPCEIPEFKNNRDMVRFCLDNLHHLEKHWFSDEVHKEQRMNTPCSFYHKTTWGILVRGLHLAIPCVKPKTMGRREGFSPDHCYHTGFGIDKIHVIRSSDDAFSFELCRQNFGDDGSSSFNSAASYKERMIEVLKKGCWTLRNLSNAMQAIQIKHSDSYDCVEDESFLDFARSTHEIILNEIARR